MIFVFFRDTDAKQRNYEGCVRMKRYSYFEDVCERAIDYNNKSSVFEQLAFMYHSEVINNSSMCVEDVPDMMNLRPLTSYSYLITSSSYRTLYQCNDFFEENFNAPNLIYPHTTIEKLNKIELLATERNWYVSNFSNMGLLILVKPNPQRFSSGVPDKTLEGFIKALVRDLEKTNIDTLNTSNESLKKSRRFLKGVLDENIYDPSIYKTLSNLVAHFKLNYGSTNQSIGEISEIFLCKNDFKNDKWETFFGEIYNDLVKEKVENFYYRRKENTLNPYENRMPITFKESGVYFLLIPIAKNFDKEYFRYALLITNDRPIEHFILKNINEVIADYFIRYIEEQKRTLLTEMQAEYFSNILNLKKSRDALKSLARYAFEKIINITNAYSATIRLFNPARGTLKLFAEANNKEENAIRTVSMDEIFFSDFRGANNKRDLQGKSLNCRMFMVHERLTEEGIPIAVYEGCLFNYYDAKKSTPQNKIKTLPAREQTASDLCMPFYYKNIKIGTVNFESPIVNGFDSECALDDTGKPERVLIKNGVNRNGQLLFEKCVKIRSDSFLYAVKVMLENYYALLCGNNDSHFLARLIQRESNMHDLIKVLNSDEDLNAHRDYMLNLVGEIRGVSEKKPETLAAMVGVRNEKINERKLKLGKWSERIPNIEITLPMNKFIHEKAKTVPLSGEEFSALSIIYKNLIANFFKYGAPELGDRLMLKYNKNTKILRISQTLTRPLPLTNDDARYFETPIHHNNSSGKSMHSGLFIVGVLVRQLGGYIYHDIDEFGFIKKFEIRIKLKGLNEND